MLPLPHHYVVTAIPVVGEIHLISEGLSPLSTEAPVEFDGPGGLWSPETMLVGAAADCFAITFRGVARASHLEWLDMRCAATGTLDRVDGVMRFTTIELHVHLTLAEGIDHGLAHRVLDKAKRSCLITNSMNAEVRLEATIAS
ncbi:MAG: OsmC family protein [Acidobacteriaceae bacterium]|jgi:peroxiredoxin-like protein|nr:OsmC family protein [Acidobacteriaceae bacterium]